jgi:hypothetical protein
MGAMAGLARGAVAAFVWATSVATLPAQPAVNEAAQAMVGNWEFSNADRDKRCAITFRAEPASHGMKLVFDPGCAALFPFIQEIVGWSIAPNDFLRLIDTKGRPVLEFSELEVGLFEAPRPGEGILFIQNAAAAGPAPRTTEQMIGDWSLVHGDDKPICTVTLLANPAGQDFALRVKPGCDPYIVRFAPRAWAMDRSELLLKGARDGVWRFSEGESPASWQRVPEGPEPLLLVRP